jgi:hypothetical protein
MANGSSGGAGVSTTADIHSPSPVYASHSASRTGTPSQAFSQTQGESSRSGSAADFARRGSVPPQSAGGMGASSATVAGATAIAAATAIASQSVGQASQQQQQGQAPVMVGQQQGPPPSRSNHPPGIMGTLMHGFDVTKDQGLSYSQRDMRKSARRADMYSGTTR